MKKAYNIVYAIIIVSIIIYFVVMNDYNDMIEMLLAAVAIILTSVFTYSNRK